MITNINEFKKINETLTDNPTYGLPVNVYKTNFDASANGITSNNDRLLLVYDNIKSPFEVNDNEDYLVLLKNGDYLYAKPKSLIDANVHSMFGGNFIFTSDSRFPNKYPIAVHDRVEK